MQQAEFVAAGTACGGHGFHDFHIVCHAGGHNHWPALAGDVFDERDIHQLEQGDLVGWRVEFFEEVHSGGIEGRRKSKQAALAGSLEKGFMPIPRGMSPFVKLMKLPARARP